MKQHLFKNVVKPSFLDNFNCNGTGDSVMVEFCCTKENPCSEGDGDCDVDEDCKDGLICGTNNCDKSKFNFKWADCCEEGMKSYFNNFST